MDADSRRLLFARAAFASSALVGLGGIGAGALYGVTWSTTDAPWRLFLEIAVPIALGWSAFCYGAYRALFKEGLGARVLLGSFVLLHLPMVPVGTAIAGVVVWLRMTRRASPEPPE